MKVIQNLLSKESAKEVSKQVMANGTPSEDRIILAVPNSDAKTSTGLIIPGKTEDIPKKGVIVGFGMMDMTRPINKHMNIGDIITFGNYAGKEIEFDNGFSLDSVKFTVLSIEEVIYIESNNN